MWCGTDGHCLEPDSDWCCCGLLERADFYKELTMTERGRNYAGVGGQALMRWLESAPWWGELPYAAVMQREVERERIFHHMLAVLKALSTSDSPELARQIAGEAYAKATGGDDA